MSRVSKLCTLIICSFLCTQQTSINLEKNSFTQKKKIEVAIKEVITYTDVYTININIAEEIMLQVTDLILYFKQLENKPDISKKGEIITEQKS